VAVPTSNELKRWEEDLLAEQQQISKELEPLLSRREQVRTKLELIQRLRVLEDGEAHLKGKQSPEIAPISATGRNEIQEHTYQILRESGKPMHVSEIKARLIDRAVPIPGRGTDANIIVHLRRAPRVFERKARGTYGLLEWKAAARGKQGKSNADG
jgi:hypothetical protein